MKEQFVPYEQALKLKELGFDEPCLIGVIENENYQGNGFSFTNFNNNIHDFVLPLWQQAFDWFREKHNLDVQPMCVWETVEKVDFFKEKPTGYILSMLFIYEGTYSGGVVYKTYEEARQACLEKLIELCQQKK